LELIICKPSRMLTLTLPQLHWRPWKVLDGTSGPTSAHDAEEPRCSYVHIAMHGWILPNANSCVNLTEAVEF
jgi:hypothetical protein